MTALYRCVSAALVTSLAVLLSGCTIGTPWPRMAPMVPGEAEEAVVLVLTRVVVDTTQREEFDRQNSRVLASMGQHPGLVGYAARREIFGSQGWTMTVWANEEARAAFVASTVHREAVRRSMSTVVAAEFKRLTVPRKDLPANWDAVLPMLADPEGLRNHWE